MPTPFQRLPMLGLVLMAVGCGSIDHNEYIDRRATAECKKYRVCVQGFYDSEFRDFDDCVDERADSLDEADDNLPNSCDYDGEEARRCVSRVSNMGCEEFTEQSPSSACDLVWDCNG